MNFRFAPLVVCAFVAASTSLAGSTVSLHTISPLAIATLKVPHARANHIRSSAASLCVGRDSTGHHSFNGVPNVGNIAGGVEAQNNPDPNQYAGVVAGCNNVAGDNHTGILAGIENAIQPYGHSGDNDSSNAVIVGGEQNVIMNAPDSSIASGGSNKIDSASASVIAAGGDNLIHGGPGQDVAFEAGIVAGMGNTVEALTSFIGAGTKNIILQPDSLPPYQSSVIVGGDNNQNLGSDNFIAGGALNVIGNSSQSQASQYAAIGGGHSNSILSNYATIAGGSSNSAAGQNAIIGGGYRNSVTSLNGAILGGAVNVASGYAAAIGGGSTNVASGRQAAVPGGELNIAAGMNSFAAGTRSIATTAGSFVWSDDATNAKTITTAAPNVFLVRASGGVAFYSAANLASGVSLAPGSGAWSTLSDRNVKTGIEQVDETRILAKLAAMPVSEWSYTAQGTGVRHLGPMAQDFRAAFGLGEDDRHISTVDEEGVALAAVKALQTEVVQKNTQIAQLQRAQSNTERAGHQLEAKYARLAARLDALEANAVRQAR